MSVIGIHTSSLVSASRHGKCGGFWASWVFPGVHQGTRQVATPPNHPMCWIRATGSFFSPERLLPESRPPGRTAPARHRHEEEVSTRVPKQGGNNKKPQGHTNNQNFVWRSQGHTSQSLKWLTHNFYRFMLYIHRADRLFSEFRVTIVSGL